MNYKATIHTMEIQPILNDEYADHAGKWVQMVHRKAPACVSRKWVDRYDGTARAIINTHRLNPTPEGKYIFTYGGLQEHLQNMQAVCEEIEAEDYIIKRMDVCLDAEVPYELTQKLTRLIALMLGEKLSMNNRYESIEPLTGEAKTLRLDNGTKTAPSRQQIEHYNRELVGQIDYVGKPIINRFELRSMGLAAGALRTEADIVNRWIDQLDVLTERDMNDLCQKLNERLVTDCGKRLSRFNGFSSTAINYYLTLFGAECIYTRQQLEALLDMLGIENPATHAKNLLDRKHGAFELYRWKQVHAEIEHMNAALTAFVQG